MEGVFRDLQTFQLRARGSVYDATDAFQNTWIRILDPVGRGSEAQSQHSHKSRDASRLIQETESSDNQFTVELEQLEQFDVDVFIDYCLPRDQCSVPEGNRWTKLFSTLILAVSSLPRSSSVAISRLALFACASFFSWSVRRRWTDRLDGRDVGGAALCCGKGDQVPCLNLWIMSRIGRGECPCGKMRYLGLRRVPGDSS